MTKIIAVGHRGTAQGVPENSIASHEAAIKMGARGIEFDIRTTADGKFVLFHDDHLGYKTTGKGRLASKTLNDLKDVRLRYKTQVTDHKIPTLEEALQNVRGRFCVDLDFKSGLENSAEILRPLLKDAGFEDSGAPLVTIFCRGHDDYNKIKALNDIYAVRPLFKNSKHCQEMKNDGIDIMGLREYQLRPKNISCLHDRGLHVFVNTMEEKKSRVAANHIFERILRTDLRINRKKPRPARLLQIHQAAVHAKPLFIQTDYLDALVNFLKAKDLYQETPIDRNFQPQKPPQTDSELAV